MKDTIKEFIIIVVTKLKLTRLISIIFRAIKFIIPSELKPKSKLELKLEDNLADETFNHF